jgi:hypothetical protein
MNTVFSLRDRLKNDPQYVAAVQARTLDGSKLPGGLKGVYGLFGSDQWWKSIAEGVAPVTRLSGTILSVAPEGMHNEGRGFEMKMPDGSSYKYSCVVNRKEDRKRYVIGKKIEVVYVTEPLKNPVPVANGRPQTLADTVVEISIED